MPTEPTIKSAWMCVYDIALKRWTRALYENSPAEDNRRVLRRAVKEWMR